MNILLIFALLGFLFVKFLSATWDSPTTWEGTAISVSDIRADSQASLDLFTGESRDSFTFSTGYCYLYSVTVITDKTISFRCSSLPLAYIRSSEGKTLGTVLTPDIEIIVGKNTPLPKYFLDKTQVTSQAITENATPNVPVSVSVKGKVIRPEKTARALLTHFVTILRGEKSSLDMAVTEYEVHRLDGMNDLQKEMYAKTWAQRVKTLLKNEFSTELSKKAEAQTKLNFFRAYFEPTVQKCSALNGCVPEYKENPAEKIAFYMYGLTYTEANKQQEHYALFKSGVYPFKGTYPVAPTRVWDNSVTPWTIFSVYNYSVCPIAEVIKGETNANTEMFISYSKALEKYDALTPNKEEFLKASPRSMWLGVEGWDSDYIGKFDRICAGILKDGKAANVALKNRVIEISLEMLTTQIGQKVTYDKKTLENLIYSLSSFSPYRTPLLYDSVLTLERRKGVESFESQKKDKIEWKSVLNTLIILYLYEAI